MLALLLLQTSAAPVLWKEAEACPIVCDVQQNPGDSVFASGGRFTPHYWGQTPGDKITWPFKLEKPLASPWLAVRYAYGKKEFGKNLGSARRLAITVNSAKAGELHVPDTGAWAHYEVAWVRLPNLPAEGTIAIETFEPETNTDVDCLGLFWRRPNPGEEAAPFVKTLVAISKDGIFHYRRSPNAKVPEPEGIFAQFKRIRDAMDAFGGWKPAPPVGINVIEDALWPSPGWSAFSNGAGCFFRASHMPTDYGNWCHEMTHLLFEGRCPRWLEESLVHTLTRLVWVTRLYADDAEKAIHRNAMVGTGRDFRENPSKTFDSVEPVLYALADKYGIDVFGRFFKACIEAGKAGELDMTPGRHLTKAEVMKYLSKAAGEDVTPFFKRWTGFAGI